MAGTIISEVKNGRALEYLFDKDKPRAEEILISETYSPITKSPGLHRDAEGDNKEINNTFTDILNDLSILDKEIYLAAARYEELVNDTLSRFQRAESIVVRAKEKLKDINMLCGDNSEFFFVKTLEDKDFQEVYFDNDVISLPVTSSAQVQIEVTAIDGNGQDGNLFVYANNAFLSDVEPTSNRGFITDGDPISYFEYQRLRTKDKKKQYFVGINVDQENVFCSFHIKASEAITSLTILSDDKSIEVMDIQISNDGKSYTDFLSKPYKINEKEASYTNKENVLIGANAIHFPLSQHIIVTLSTDAVTNDRIAFEYSPSL